MWPYKRNEAGLIAAADAVHCLQRLVHSKRMNREPIAFSRLSNHPPRSFVLHSWIRRGDDDYFSLLRATSVWHIFIKYLITEAKIVTIQVFKSLITAFLTLMIPAVVMAQKSPASFSLTCSQGRPLTTCQCNIEAPQNCSLSNDSPSLTLSSSKPLQPPKHLLPRPSPLKTHPHHPRQHTPIHTPLPRFPSALLHLSYLTICT